MIGSWKKKAIGQLFDIQLGKMLNEKAKTGPQFPYLANYNVRWGYFDLSQLNEMTFSDREKDKYKLQKGDLLMCEGGEIGRCAIWQRSDVEIYYQKALHRVRPKGKEALTEYLYFYMQFIASQGNLSRIVGETSIAHLTREKLLGLTMTYPSLPEQKAIADLLSTWDEGIEKIERLVKAKERRFKWLLRELISEPQNASEGMERKKTKFKNIFKPNHRKNANNAKLPVLSVTTNGIVFQSEYFKKEVASDDKSVYWVVENGDFVMSGLNFWMGSVDFQTICDAGLVSPAYKVFKLISGSCIPKYLHHFIKSKEMIKILDRSSVQGASIVRRNLDIDALSNSYISLPSEDMQFKIAEILTFTQQEIDMLKQLLDKYKTQKRGLMQKMLTGEWRVKAEIAEK